MKTLLCILSAAFVLSLEAATGYYIGTGNANKAWSTASLWQDGTVPHTADDLAVFKAYTNSVTAPLETYAYNDLHFNSVTVGAIASAPIGTRLINQYADTYNLIGATTNCWAQWITLNYRSGYKTLPNGGEPVELKNVYGGRGPTFYPQNADESIRVVNLYGQAAFTKEGPGELELVNPAGLLSVGYLKAGTLTIGTAAVDDDCAYAANPYSHWDAAQIPAADIGEPDAAGRRELAKWAAASDGNSRHATVSVATAAPFLGSRTVTVPGHDTPVPLVDFGAAAGSDTSVLGTPRGLLSNLGSSTTDPAKNLREIFYVAEATTPASGKSFLTRDGNFHYATTASRTACFASPSAGKGYVQVYGGAGMLDGVPYGGTEYLYYRDECDLAVYSSYTLTNMLDVGLYHMCGGSGSSWSSATGGGGYRAAEILTYYRALTDAERRQTIRYLQRKWLEGRVESYTRDVGALFVQSAAAQVKVNAGKLARVRSVVASSPLVKTGAGTLEIDRIYPKGTANVTVNAGGVRFNATGKPAVKTVPADGLWFHGDASVASSFVYVDGDAAKGISQWKDARGAGHDVAFTNALVAGRTNPMRVVGRHNGYCVDFGGTAVAENTYANLRANASANVVEGFIVWRNKTASNVNANCPGPWYDSQGGCRSHYYWLFQDNAGYGNAARFQACSATYDGVPIATDGFYGKAQSDNAVIAAAFQQSTVVTHLGVANNNTAKGGCQEVYEVLFYTRRLKDQERRNIEAYLLDKWHEGAVHPAETVSMGTLAFGAAAEPVLDVATNTAVAIASVTGTGTLVKTGAGTASVTALGAGLTGVELRGGSLGIAGDCAAPSAFTIRIDRAGNVAGGLSATGALTLPDGGTLTVLYDETVMPAVGTFPFATAGSVSGGANWTVVCTNPKFTRRLATVSVDARSVSLKIARRGCVLVYR